MPDRTLFQGEDERSGSAPPASPPEPAGEPCPACGSTEHTLLFRSTDRLYRTTKKQFEIVECKRCHLIRLHPRPEPGELPCYYPPEYWFEPGRDAADRLEEGYRRFVVRDHVRFVKRALDESGETGSVLDVGCGGGLFLNMLAARGARVTGLDFSLDAASVAWLKQGVPAVCASLARAPFAPESFAVITMFHVLEHLYEPPSYLEAARALLRPRGRLIVQVPNAASWQFLLLGENWSGLDVPRHLMNFRVSDLEALLERCGFEVLRRKFFSLRDNPAGLATSLAPWLDPMARRVRAVRDGPRTKLLKDALYFCLVAACLPFALLEAACHAGTTVMLEARKRE
jgi:SAM-dependent methyltransferase